MRAAKRLTLALAILASVAAPVSAQQRVRVATYNIQFLNDNISAERAERLRTVVRRLAADVIALQEIDDRAALENIFPTQDWQVVIDDDSGDTQDVAVAVRKPFKVVGLNDDPEDLDADDDDFLFPSESDPVIENAFPNNRDVLKVEVEVPDSGGSRFFVFVVHAKARVQSGRPGRNFTEPRRVAAAEHLLRALEQGFDESDFVVLGDFNDNCDDRSLNVLETGNPTVLASKEEADGPFLINLCEPLIALGHVSHGRTEADIQGDRINTIDPLSRDRNFNAVGTNVNTGDILFDQLLIPIRMGGRHIPGSTQIFDEPVAIQGPGSSRASDHLPVFADFAFGGDEDDDVPPPPPGNRGIRIVSLLPNPDGPDEGNETITIANGTGEALSLDGWLLRDRAGNELALSGSVEAGGTRVITLPRNSVPLNNSGDDVALIDDRGEVRHRVTYAANQVRPGQEVAFE